MAIIQPYSSLGSETKNPVTTTRYPWLKHFFQCKETSGTTMTDAITGRTHIPALTPTFATQYAITVGATGSGGTGTISGNLTDPGTSNFLFQVVWKPANTSAQVLLGDTTMAIAPGIRLMGAQTSQVLVKGVTTTISLNPTTADFTNVHVHTLVGSWSGSDLTATYYEDNDAGVASVGTATGAINFNASFENINFRDSDVYGFFLGIFTTLPTEDEIQAAGEWHKYYWQNSGGDKAIYPGWLYRT